MENATAQKRVITIYTESNPNPSSLKFVTNMLIMPEGANYDFPNLESASNSPLAQDLFKFSYITRIFYASNFITITKKDEFSWDTIVPELKEFIKNYLEMGKKIFADETFMQPGQEIEENEIVKKIKGLLDEYVKPAVEQDGGAISFKSFDNGVVTVILQGSCSGCPSSTVTLKAGIENMMKRMIPEVTEVVAENM
jgi:NFU1 iron-sulfur cluster scaffold homolog, mitochondrial